MDTKRKYSDKLDALSDADRKRLARLAALAEISEQEMLFFVRRDGFEVCEQSIGSSLEADAYFEKNRGVDNAAVTASVRRLIASHAKRTRSTD